MEYITGGSLFNLLSPGASRGRMRRRRLPLREAFRIFEETLNGVDALHLKRVRHRDLKPGNVLLDVRRGRSAKLCDLGLAKDSARTPGVTPPADLVLGTPGYNAPEILIDPAQADHRADYFSLGCILVEMLAGRPAFSEYHYATQNEQPQGLDDIRAEHGDEIAGLAAQLLEKDPADRLTDPLQVRDRVRQINETVVKRNRRFWKAHWPQLSRAVKNRLSGLLLDDSRAFRHGKLRRLGLLIALHSQRTALIEFGETLAEIHGRMWLTLAQLGDSVVQFGTDSSGSTFLGQQEIEYFRNCEELLALADKRLSSNLRVRLGIMDSDVRLVKAYELYCRRCQAAFDRRPTLGPIRSAAEVQRRLDGYKSTTCRIWRKWLRLRERIVDRIRECSEQLMVHLASFG